ncbi:hypothetical protein GCM10027275_56470 [Rhabdobacter roseus]
MGHQRVISRAQLPRLLAKVNGSLFNKLLFDWFGFQLDPTQRRWFALDGKELCGSIQPHHKRGEACVSALSHTSEQIVGQLYYNGRKESERPTVRQLLNQTGLYNQKLTLDALHLTPQTLKAIHGAQGGYLVGLKPNQAHLYRFCVCTCLMNRATYEHLDAAQRGHGRIEQRSYCCFPLNTTSFAPRWKDAGISILIRVQRIRQKLDGSPLSEEVNYFLSNLLPTTQKDANELFEAIRHHWRIEAMHHRRDMTLAEDSLRTASQPISRLMSSLRSLALNVLRRARPKNMAAQIDSFADKFQTLIQFMTQELVL